MIKTEVMQDLLGQQTYEVIHLADAEELKREILSLKGRLAAINFICSYGWQDVRTECNRIRDLSKEI